VVLSVVAIATRLVLSTQTCQLVRLRD